MGAYIGSITISRTVAILPVADPAGCIELDVGSGSGSGCCDNGQDCPDSECTQLSPDCPNGLSTQFSFDDPTHPGNTVTLDWLCNPSDGNYSRFLSTGGVWSFSREENPLPGSGVDPGWVLTNLITGEAWAWPDTNGPICDLGITGFTMIGYNDGKFTDVDMFATNDCYTSSYDCEDGTCIGKSGDGGTYDSIEACNAACVTTYNCEDGNCVEVTGAGGDFPSLGECQAMCGAGDVVNGCCAGGVPRSLKMVFSNVTGTCVGCVESMSPSTLIYEAASPGVWTSPVTHWPCRAGGLTDFWQLGCFSTTWNLSFTGGIASPTLVSSSCSPFQLVFDVPNTGGGIAGLCGTGTGTVRVTITAA